MRGRLLIGTSGYQYPHWRGPVYPADLPQSGWFDYYQTHFDSVEINNTFYRLPGPEVFDRWRERARPGFLYALKFSRYGSHIKRLREPQKSLAPFVERARRLESHLGPVLVQLPPRWRANPGRLQAFLEALPAGLRWVFEFRDPRWLDEEIFGLLETYGVALCIHDMIQGHPWRLTTDWTYLRFHGGDYTGCYSPQFLSAQARRIRAELEQGHDCHVYFNNDANGHAFHNALALERYLGWEGKKVNGRPRVP